jgi:cellulose synthase/poly-beta-1,6-N-acetylglucosamine synthase-like glycosyltransferase
VWVATWRPAAPIFRVGDTHLSGPEANVHIDPLRVLHERPEECACWTLDARQKWALAILGVVLCVGLVLATIPTLIALNAVVITFYILQSIYKFFLVWRSLGRQAEVQVTPEDLHAVPDADLPSYTILIPLFREAEVLGKLVHGLSELDYPVEKLQIMLLLEENDTVTVEAAQSMDLPAHFLRVIVPDSQPKTKPKACNWGLDLATSDLLVIYDAEDVPERDQLRKAAAAFRKVPPQVACLQAKLNYFNQRQNLLTRWFTAEYSVWFDLFLPGLTASGAPIPLGGTSNHFRVAPLRDLGGWDPYNVTEDCDLGVRLHKHGYRAAMIDSTTWEEANSNFWGWIRQRSRWVKGYIQTYLVHTRRPLKLLRQLGLRNWFSFQMTVGGSIVCFLLNPLYWLLTVLWMLTGAGIINAIFPGPIYVAGVFCLLVGNFVFVYLNVAGCMNRGYYDLVKHAVITPLYWLMMSWAAYKAFGQLIINPHYWEKTRHGLTRSTPS